MPTEGDKSAKPCPVCAEPRYWKVGTGSGEARRGTVGSSHRTIQSFAGWVCANSHVSDACPLCGDRNTDLVAHGPRPGQRVIQCNACGYPSTVSV